MASALREHWRGVLTRRLIDRQLLSEWLAAEAPPTAPPSDAAWRLQRDHVQTAIDRSPNAAPGPDGISTSVGQGCPPSPTLVDMAVDIRWLRAKDFGETSSFRLNAPKTAL
ncbi:unnamed protein product, partial [Prorocentrum cordatum]